MADQDSDFINDLNDTVDELEGETNGESVRRRTRGGTSALTMKVYERDGVLLVDDGSRRVRGEKPWTRQLSRLETAQVGDWLYKLDKKLTPNQGLRRFHDGELSPVEGPQGDGRVLLLVHGTFSNSDNMMQSISRNTGGSEFLGWATERYSQILTFDHPTLQVNPLLNALELARHFDGYQSPVDVICHSRGGLVVRWWLDALDRSDPTTRRGVFVGSPLAGTSLASPPRLRGSLSLITNIAAALGHVSAAIPFTVVAAGVFKVVASVTKIAAKTPAIDAAVALVPGLIAQSRVGNNQELLSARRREISRSDRYFAVQSNFESSAEGWKFWRYFRDIGSRAKDIAADVVFQGQNDLVVDTNSMTELSDDLSLPDDHVFGFGTSETVHHTNYFDQPETLAFIRSKLDV